MEINSVTNSASSRYAQVALFRNVYMWMTFALIITGITALIVADSPGLIETIITNKIVFYGLLIGEFALVWYMSAHIRSLSFTTATMLFILYSFINGLTLSFIFLLYTASSIASTFFVTAGTFGAMCLYGYMTKRDLTSIGNLCFMAIIGLVIASVVNMFWSNDTMYWIITYAGVLIFVGLTAYDTQKIKRLLLSEGTEVNETTQKIALMGALSLYLDFINLFLYLLRLLGNRK